MSIKCRFNQCNLKRPNEKILSFLELPEFIPFENASPRNSNIPTLKASSSYKRDSSRSPLRSEEQNKRPHNSREHVDQRRPSRDSYRSLNQSSPPRTNYPARRRSSKRRSRSRSLTPQTSRARHQPISYPSEDRHRNKDRSLSKGSRNGSSVFDRISPPERQLGRCLSGGSQSQPSQPRLFRTINTSTSVATHSRMNIEELSNDMQTAINRDAMMRQLRDEEEQRRLFIAQTQGQIVSDQRQIISDPRQIVSDPRQVAYVRPFDSSVEMRNMKERLIAAETHCLELERTVRSLKQVIHNIMYDFQVIMSRNR